MKIVTWNVNGIRARHGEVLALIDRERPDVVCLQELKARRDQVPETLCNLAGYWCYWHGAGAYSGVGLHVSRARMSDAPEFRHPAFDHETRIVEVTLGDLVVASVYVPNGGKDYFAKVDFLRAMEEYAAGVHAAGRTLIVCGDLNVAHTDRDVHPKERKANAIGQLPEEREIFDRILGRGLVDVGRALDPDNQNLFTWWAPWRNLRQRNIGWRLDYVLASTAVAERAESCPAFREIGTSDHAPVVATFRDL
ncbi:MAG: exodeoxyribonuclease [Candidatus Binatota bacterium]|jgi:exodeoxyribonuclease-3|nr:exodeoxyribonuclease [Candidatus Binatota bacterium]